MTAIANDASTDRKGGHLVRGLGQLDATMIVIGSMIGSGIFITSAESARLIGAPGWLLLAWALAGLLTITGALCCAELAAMMPRAGGQYVFLREAYGPLFGFLFGWAIFLVVQTGHHRRRRSRLCQIHWRARSSDRDEQLSDRADSPRKQLCDQPFHRATRRRRLDPPADLEQHPRPGAWEIGAELFHLREDRPRSLV